MDFGNAPTEIRNDGTFYTRQAEAALVQRIRMRDAELLARLADR